MDISGVPGLGGLSTNGTCREEDRETQKNIIICWRYYKTSKSNPIKNCQFDREKNSIV